jgi:hypothetical protein
MLAIPIGQNFLGIPIPFLTLKLSFFSQLPETPKAEICAYDGITVSELG